MVMPGLERSVLSSMSQTITVAGTAIGPTAANASGANAAFFGPVETADVRWWADGTVPTASVGHKLIMGQTLYLEGDAVARVLFIRTAAVSAAIPVTYYG